MTLEGLAGRRYGPYPVATSQAKTDELVTATGDDPDRWRASAPPSYAAALLFAAAPRFFADPDVAAFTGALIHSDQRFAWHRPFDLGAALDVSATVEAVRSRRSLNLVTFVVEVADGDDLVLESRSSFVMAEAGPAPDDVPGEPEPPVAERGANDPPEPLALPAAGGALPPLHKSASRADLVRYAAASGDFNPIHWDHESARGAGLPGVIVHGLLVGAWAMQAAGRVAATGPAPLASMQLRFRRFVRPAVPVEVAAVVTGIEGGLAALDLDVGADGQSFVTGSASVRV